MTLPIQPVLVLSLPGAGSTLLQRLLGAHQAITTRSEPWLLLPVLYASRGQGAYAEYGHALAAATLQDFCRSLPRGRAGYLSAVRRFALDL